MIEKYLTYMRDCGWDVVMNEEQTVFLPEPMKSRYKKYPESWLSFISVVKSMESGDEKVWFLCADDYDIQGDTAWQWNEWELLGLEAAGNDAVWKDNIKRFWDEHLPIVLSLESGYAYYAISMKDNTIVSGGEPEFEACKTVADSFEDFMKKVIKREIRL